MATPLRQFALVIAAIAAPGLALPGAAYADTRLALVIANAQYKHAPPLTTPLADAQVVEKALIAAHFKVTVLPNASKGDIEAALTTIGDAADSADVVLVYYAGHGIEIDGQNYLIPTSAELLHDRDAEIQTIRLETVRRAISSAKLRIIVLDACRNNPFLATMSRSLGTRALSGGGLAEVHDRDDQRLPRGEAILYSTGANATADDGRGGNSPFATAFARRLLEPNVEISLMIRSIRADVEAASTNHQRPYLLDNLADVPVYFVGSGQAAPAAGIAVAAPLAPVMAPIQIEALMWQGALSANSLAAFQDYLDHYPSGMFAGQARANILRIQPVAPVITEDALGQGNKFYFGQGVTKNYVEAAKWFRVSAQSGNAEAMLHLGELYHYGQGVTKDYAQAVDWYRKAALAGNGKAMTDLGYMYGSGFGVARDYAQAVQWYRKAADNGETHGMKNLGNLYETGNGVPLDLAQAVQWYLKAAQGGDSEAMANLAYMYDSGRGTPRDFAQAAQWYRKAADNGSALSMNNLGLMYDSGRGVTQDLAQAVALYRKAADSGYPQAMTDLGYMYGAGRGVAKDPVQAAQWYRKAAEAGDPHGMKNLGYMYETGEGVAQDYAQAMQWYRKSADLGDAEGMTNVGYLYNVGHGVPLDYAQAAFWYRKGAEAGDATGMTNLASLYTNGQGVPKDAAQATMWRDKAAAARAK